MQAPSKRTNLLIYSVSLVLALLAGEAILRLAGLPIRQQIIGWLDAQGIGWQVCGHFADVGLMMGYRGLRRNGRWLFSILLLAQWPISCLCSLPSSLVAAP